MQVISLLKQIVVVGFVVLSLAACGNVPEDDEISAGWKKADSILRKITVPHFPERKFLITDFGAKNDGVAYCTKAFHDAIVACNNVGGGIVVVPEGKYLTGAIHLLSNVNLHIEKGAEILFSTDPDDYLPLVRTRFEGCELMNYSPLIYAYRQQNIAITGEGVLNGQGAKNNWWAWKLCTKEEIEKGGPCQYGKNSVPRLMDMVNKGVPVEKRIFGKGYYLRSSFFQPFECKNILIEGVTIQKPPMWMIHPVLSENITIRGVVLVSPDAPNGDGCDPECCKNVLIENCVFNTGDDCIAIKAGRNRDGYGAGIPTENVIIRNCKMQDGHGGVVIGSEMSGGVRNIFVYDCFMSSPHLQRGLRIKTNKFRGGFIENIFMRNVKIGKVSEAVIRINQNYPAYNKDIPVKYTSIKNIFIENLICDTAKYAVEITGIDEYPVKNIKIMNSEFRHIEKAIVAEGVNNLVLENVKTNGNSVSQ